MHNARIFNQEAQINYIAEYIYFFDLYKQSENELDLT